jgi:hypothetical protein
MKRWTVLILMCGTVGLALGAIACGEDEVRRTEITQTVQESDPQPEAPGEIIVE